MADAPQVAYDRASPHSHQDDRTQKLPVPLPTPVSMPKQEAYAYYGEVPRNNPPPTILGLKRRNFWILVVGAVVILAATIGGSVGGSLAVRRANTTETAPITTPAAAPSSPTPTPTSASASSAVASSTATSIALVQHPLEVGRIDISCPSGLTDWNGKSYDCSEGKNINDSDLMGLYAYNMQQCIDACATLNYLGKSKCVAVQLGKDLSAEYKYNHGANCWLKSSTEQVDAKDRQSVMLAVLKV